MKVTVVEGCISCGLCVNACPEVFRFGAEDTAEAYTQPSPDQEADVRAAAENCPVSVIEVQE